MSEQYTVLIDGFCSVCTRWARFIKKRDSKSRFLIIAQETEEGEVLMSKMPEGLRGIDSVVFIDDKGDCFVRSAAIVRILYRLRFPWMFFSSIWIVPYPLRDWLYDVYSSNRTRTV